MQSAAWQSHLQTDGRSRKPESCCCHGSARTAPGIGSPCRQQQSWAPGALHSIPHPTGQRSGAEPTGRSLDPSPSKHTLTLLLLLPFQRACAEQREASGRQCDTPSTWASFLPSLASPQEAISLPIALVTNLTTDADFTQPAPVATLRLPRRMKVSPEGNVAHLAPHHCSAVWHRVPT